MHCKRKTLFLETIKYSFMPHIILFSNDKLNNFILKLRFIYCNYRKGEKSHSRSFQMATNGRECPNEIFPLALMTLKILYGKWSFAEWSRFDHHSLRKDWIFMENLLLCYFRCKSVLNITLSIIGLSSRLGCERCLDYTCHRSSSFSQNEG